MLIHSLTENPGIIRALRLTGLAGILGATLMFAGDMLYYYRPDPVQSVTATMTSVPDWRLLAGGALAPFACWLYTLGSWQMFLALQPAGQRLATVAFGSFAALMIFYGIFHAVFAALGFGAQTTRLASYLDLLLQIAYIPTTIWTALFVFAVLFRPTRYPRWVVLFTPTFYYLIRNAIVPFLPGVLYVIIGGGFNNLILLVFYTLSTLLLWNGGQRINIKTSLPEVPG